jgi:hypothetical protein
MTDNVEIVNIDEVDEVDDVAPLKSNNVPEQEMSLPDLSQIDMSKLGNMDMSKLGNMDMSKMGDMMETLKNKNPSDLLRMMRNMGITDGQIEQMKKQYKNGGIADHSQETDLRKRLKSKMNEMRTMRQTNTIKQQYIEKIQEEKGEMVASINPVAIELSKKTLANRKKAQKKKEKKKTEKGATEAVENKEEEEIVVDN